MDLRTLPRPDALRIATADDVFLLVGDARSVDGTRASLVQMCRLARRLPWDAALTRLRALAPERSFECFTVSASALGRRNYSRFEVEDAVGAGAADVLGIRYRATRAPERGAGELAIRVHLVDDRIAVGLRVFDVPLHRRAYKQQSCPGTLHPPLAAAMALLAGLRPDSRLLDPCAGAGTVPIEALRLEPGATACAADLDGARLALARANGERAGARVPVTRADVTQLPYATAAFTRVVTNLPWGVRVAAAGTLAGAPRRRDEEIGRVLDESGRAVFLVHAGDPLAQRGPTGGRLTLLHRSWISVFGQQPRLCVLARSGSADGAVDPAALLGPQLLRTVVHAETAEYHRPPRRRAAPATHPPWRWRSPRGPGPGGRRCARR